MMSEKKQLSVFWGEKSLFFIETTGISAHKKFCVSLEESKSADIKMRAIELGNLELTSRIQNALRENKVSTLSLNLSLPAKDIIFRSFTIPRLHPSEIKNIVDFEARKYVPFDLNTLCYSYHAMPIVDNNLKRTQIIFVGMKKISLESYIDLFEQATLEVNLAEPEPISLIRLLYHKNFILEDKTIVLLTLGNSSINIIIASQRIPCFVREIEIKDNSHLNFPEEENLIAISSLINEVRISIEYYKRQSNQAQIDQLILLTSGPTKEIMSGLKQNFDFEVSTLTPEVLFQDDSINDIEYLNAYGSCLFEHVETPADFLLNTSNHYSKIKSITSFKKATQAYRSIFLTFALCFLSILSVFLLSKYSISSPQKEISALTEELGSIKDASTDRLRDKNEEIMTKLNHFKEIRQKSHIALLLSIIPGEFPEGIWLNTLDLYYPKDAPLINKEGDIKGFHGEAIHRPIIELSGYAYLNNASEQFKIVSKLINNLKDHAILSKLFSNIELKTIKSQKSDEQYEITFFKIYFD